MQSLAKPRKGSQRLVITVVWRPKYRCSACSLITIRDTPVFESRRHAGPNSENPGAIVRSLPRPKPRLSRCDLTEGPGLEFAPGSTPRLTLPCVPSWSLRKVVLKLGPPNAPAPSRAQASPSSSHSPLCSTPRLTLPCVRSWSLKLRTLRLTSGKKT